MTDQGHGSAVKAELARQADSGTRALLLPATVAAITAIAGLVAFVGSDARWLAALGKIIASRHAIPVGVPYATAPTAHWPNVIVLAELVFDGLESALGDRGLMLAQLLAVGVAATVLARDGLAGGATPVGTAAALLTAALGELPSLAIARVQLFSLALFPIVVALLRSEARRPSRRIWLVVPLLALWSNLHGAALIGLGVTGIYLALVRLRDQPITAVGVGVAALAALCLTPAGLRTASYYHGVLTNVAAQRGEGLWAPITPSAPTDVLLALAVVALALRWRRAKPRGWELAVIVVLGALTIHASRSGVWLLFFLVGPAARAIRPKRTWQCLAPLAAVASIAALAFAIARGPLPSGASPTLVARAIALAGGTPVLAADQMVEQVPLAGGRISVGNPIDAFSHRDQAAYLDWLQGNRRGRGALTGIRVVLVTRGSPAQALMARASDFAVVAAEARAMIYGRIR